MMASTVKNGIDRLRIGNQHRRHLEPSRHRGNTFFWDAIQYFTGQRYTLTKLQNTGNFKLFSHRVLTTAKKAQNLERTL